MIPFMVPGSDELAHTVVASLSFEASRAVLLQNHGLVTLGEDFEEALNIAEEVDEAARIMVLTAGKASTIPLESLHHIRE
jgi:ribulose-5-phosphate 4-epimerase/fuculose-1-phosphate aldolase